MNQKTIKIIGAALLLICVIASSVYLYGVIGANNTTALEQNNKIYDLQNQIDAAKKSVSTNELKVIERATGFNKERAVSDNELIKGFLETCMTWDSYDSYEANRVAMVEVYGFSYDDQFMKMFYPEVVQVVEQTSSGEIRYLDRITLDGLNCEYGGHTYIVTGVSSNIYSYFITTQSTVVDKNGNANHAGTSIFLIDVNSNGDITNVQAYVPVS